LGCSIKNEENMEVVIKIKKNLNGVNKIIKNRILNLIKIIKNITKNIK